MVQLFLAFNNCFLLVSKSNNQWRAIGLQSVKSVSKPWHFKMETPEAIRLSLQKGEWVTLLDFNEVYFHIPINHRSRKYLTFFLNNQTFQIITLPFDHSPVVVYKGSQRSETPSTDKDSEPRARKLADNVPGPS